MLQRNSKLALKLRLASVPPSKSMLGGKGGLPPAWITDPSVEGPAGEETRGGAVVGIFTAEQVRAVIEFFTSC